MTTPVEMKYGQSSTGEFSQQSMAFLYGNTELGKLGKNGNVDVVDVKPLTVIAIGVPWQEESSRCESRASVSYAMDRSSC